jgi:TolB-like protein/Tfp pilus assembly protein PilF
MTESFFLQRLKARKIVQWALAYLAGSFVLFQLLDALAEPLGLSPFIQRIVLAAVLVGFLVTLILAWYHGEQGRQRVSGPELLMIALLLGIAGGVMALLSPKEGVRDPGPGSREGSAEDGGQPSIAVLPLANYSPDASDAYFADGVHEEITARLSQISALKVIARSSVEQYRENPPPAEEIASALGVDYLLEGSARIAGDLVRITVQLIDGRTAEHIWADSFNRDFSVENLIAVQVEIAQEVTERLQAAITPAEKARIGELPTDNPEAYAAYLRPLSQEFRGYEESDFRFAARMYQRAVELDPNFALAWAELSQTHAQIYWFAFDRSPDRVRASEDALERALELAPNNPAVRLASGYFHYNIRGDYETALRELDLALELQPNYFDAYATVGYVHRRMGNLDLAAENIEKAYRLDPLAPRLSLNLGETYFLMRAYPEAEEALSRAASLLPEFARPYAYNALMQIAWKGDVGRAVEILEDGISAGASPGEDDFLAFTLVLVDQMDGRFSDALERIDVEGWDLFTTQFYFAPASLVKGEILTLMGEDQGAQLEFQAAQAELSDLLEEYPQDERLHSAMGLTLAALGRKDDAIREGRRGAELMPRTRDAYKALYRLEDLARIYAIAGERELAVDVLEDLVDEPGILSGPWLEVDPRFRILSSHPRFQALLNAGSLAPAP